MSDNLEIILDLELDTSALDEAISKCESNTILSEIGDFLQQTKDNIENAAKEGLEEAAEDIADLEKMFITINRSIITGGLITSIEVNGESEYSFSITPTAEYAMHVEEGRGEVKPVTARVLHWVDYGEDVFRMKSNPSTPRPFVEPAYERSGQRAVKFVEEAINEIL